MFHTSGTYTYVGALAPLLITLSYCLSSSILESSGERGREGEGGWGTFSLDFKMDLILQDENDILYFCDSSNFDDSGR